MTVDSSTQFELVYDLPHFERLECMIADARLLLSYVVGTATPHDEALVNELTDVTYTLESLLSQGVPGEATKEVEKRFLVLYDKLAAISAPVSASSIRHTIRANKTRFFGPTVVASIVALVVFSFVVFAQGYWVVGKRFRDQIQRHDTKKQELLIRNFSMDDGLWHIEQRKRLLDAGDCSEVDDQSRQTSGASNRMVLEKTRKCTLDASLEDERLRLLLNQKPVRRELQEVIDQTAPVMAVVTDWYTLSSWSTFGTRWDIQFNDDITNTRAKAETQKAQITSINATSTSPFFRLNNESRIRRIDAETETRTQAIEQRRARVLIHRMDINLDIVQSYLTPSLLGLLGALMFVLRDTAFRIKRYTFIPDSSARGVGRIVVGMMAGVLGGWFVPNGDSIAKSIPPLVIPFVFGYSVELLFNLLDKAVSLFTNQQTPIKTAIPG